MASKPIDQGGAISSDIEQDSPVQILPVDKISMSDCNVELGRNTSAEIDLNDGEVRYMAVKPQGRIAMSDLQGKANAFQTTIYESAANINVATFCFNNGWSGASKVQLTINSDVWVYSTNSNKAALIIDGDFPGGLSIINNGFIVGAGGTGGGINSITNGNDGGIAISTIIPLNIRNDGYIAGGGGGGGAAYFSDDKKHYVGGGGGAGGSKGGDSYSSTFGGKNGGIGEFGGNGESYSFNMQEACAGGGGGGIVIPGVGGASISYSDVPTRNKGGFGGSSAGSGGAIYLPDAGGSVIVAAGGGGGGWGQAGGAGACGSAPGPATITSGAGGDANTAGGSATSTSGGGTTGSGGKGGPAVVTNGNPINWYNGDISKVWGRIV